MRPRRTLLVLLLAGVLQSCFPVLPTPNYIDNLRIVAIQADPATAMFDEWPPPTITVTALVVDPADDALDGATHEWSLDLPEGTEGVEWLESLIPPPPHTNVVVIDLADMGAPVANVEYITAMLPLRYVVEHDGDRREAVKLVSFLMPDFESGGGDDDAGRGGDDDSAGDDDIGDDDTGDDDTGDDDTGDDDTGDDDTADDDTGDDDTGADDDSAGDDVHPPGYNENPVIVSLTFDEERVFTAVDGQLPGMAAPLLIGPVADTEWLRIGVEVGDDKNPDDVWADLYWTAGCPGAPLPDAGPGGDPTAEIGDNLPVAECPDTEFGDNFGGTAGLRPEDGGYTYREFGWYPNTDMGGVTVRLFMVLRDEEGGQSWQEIRPE